MQVVELPGKRITLIGTAHVSRESVELVERVLRDEPPDVVCIELDERRHRALARQRGLEDLDLREIIRSQQLPTLLLQLLLSSYQRRLGDGMGVMPGAELLAAARQAEAAGIPVRLVDRDVRTTILRAWRLLGFRERSRLLAGVIAAAIEPPRIDEATLAEMRQSDVLSRLVSELGELLPSVKRVLIDERDAYLAEGIRRAPGERVVAVVGAGHLAGLRAALEARTAIDLVDLDSVPPPSPVARIAGWSIPGMVVALLSIVAWRRGSGALGPSVVAWVLATGTPTAVGAVLALAHPATILAAFLAAPLTTLSPLVGAGHVTALVQAYLRPPLVRELREVATDIAIPSRWWTSRLLRILLVFLLTSIGGTIGLWIGGADLLRSAL